MASDVPGMGTHSTLPIIDIAPYLPGAPSDLEARKETAEKLYKACRDVGFFYLCVEPFITKGEMQEELDLAREFFGRPQDEKDSIHTNRNTGFGARGYQRMRQNVTQGKADHHEGLDFYAPSPYAPGEAKALAGENQWPVTPGRLRPATEAWIDKMHLLGEATMHAMADGLEMTGEEWEQLWSTCDNSFWSMRMIDGSDGKSCGEHKDYGCLTFLHADDCPGALQVLSKDGLWLNADMVPGCMVVNIGAMWERWTGGLWPATLHRVIHKGNTYRVSHPFFFEPNFDALCGLLPAASRKAEKEGSSVDLVDQGEVKYGDYLIGKVMGNFKYDD